MNKTALITLLAIVFTAIGCSAGTIRKANMDTNKTTENSKDAVVQLNTTAGEVTLKLFGDTPKHRDNFIKLVKEGYYDGLLFHRVIKDFMVQTGDPDSRNAPKGKALGAGDPSYTIEAEILYPKHFNKRGALAAARTGDQVNPERRSSGSQFYVVTGRKFNDGQLDQMEQQLKMQQMQDIFNGLAKQNQDTIMTLRRNRDQAGLQALQEELVKQTEKIAAEKDIKGFTPEQREAYRTVGGAPHLDGAYTVFGEVISGMDTIEKIEGVNTDGNDRPLEDVKIISAKVIEE